MKTLYLIMGLPGSGKSTLASILHDNVPEIVKVEADQFFIHDDGVYYFDPTLLSRAHNWCQMEVRRHLHQGRSVVVSNTFTKEWEREIYREIAKEMGARVVEISVFTDHTDEELVKRNIHGVPVEVVKRMRERWEHSTLLTPSS